jgi:predicted dehydrogenase
MALTRRGIVVGLGSIGRRHARLLMERGDVEVQFCETDREILSAAHREIGNTESFGDYGEALGTAPDFVVVATPHETHADQTIRALDKGINVLCEKPMSHLLTEAREMAIAADRSPAILSIAFMLHFNKAFMRIRQLIHSGDLGTIVALNYRVGSYITLVNSRSRYQAGIRGALLLDYAHQPDIIYWLLGRKPRGVYCAGAHGGEMELSSNPNVLTVVCDYDDPLVTTITLNYVQMPERHEFEVIGDRGWISFDLKSGTLTLGRRKDEATSTERFSAERDEMYREEHRVFLEALDRNESPSSPPEEAIVSMEIIDASLRSLDTGERIELTGI